MCCYYYYYYYYTHTLSHLYLILISPPPQYSLMTSLMRNRWKMTMRAMMVSQNIVGNPPHLWPWRCMAMTWCSWAGAVWRWSEDK